MKSYTIEIYKDRKKLWRWRAIAKNKRIILDGGESYSRKSAVVKAVNTFLEMNDHKISVKEQDTGRTYQKPEWHQVSASSGYGTDSGPYSIRSKR